jgi:Protein of unknown function (DUF 659)
MITNSGCIKNWRKMSGTLEDEDAVEMEEHGIALDEEKKRVKCSYCGMEMNGGFVCLRRHLTASGKGLRCCSQAPQTIKSRLRKTERLRKQVDQLTHPNLPLKRHLSFCPSSSSSSPLHFSCRGDAASISPKNGKIFISEASVPITCAPEHIKVAVVMEQSTTTPVTKKEANDKDLVNFVEKAIGDFFLEAGVDPIKVNLPSFKKMLDAAVAYGSQFRVPFSEDISERILQQQVREALAYANCMKVCWSETSCTILLDTWADQGGRSLISFLVSCAQGTVFLRSVDISDDIHDVDAMFFLMGKIIEEVGKENVVQVITHDVSPHMQDIGHRVMEKYNIYWNLCADYCIDLMLGKIAEMERVSKVLDIAKAFTCFIYSREGPLQFLNKHLNGINLVKPGRWRNVAQFMTLNSILLHQDNLIRMFNSPSWTSASWASRPQATSIVEKLKRDNFWVSASKILKVTNPLIDVLNFIFGPEQTPMGTLYDALDHAKEIIKSELGGEEEVFSPYWDIIDDIWDHYLHSSIHAAGCFLNPALSYVAEFSDKDRSEDEDEEIIKGLYDCNTRMAGDLREATEVFRQIDAYKLHYGAFSDFEAMIRTKTVPAGKWNVSFSSYALVPLHFWFLYFIFHGKLYFFYIHDH